MELRSIVSTFFLLLLAEGGIHAEADLVLKNGTVITMDAEQTHATAVAISGDKILAVGTESEIASHIVRTTRVIDLHGSFVYPGLIDSHAHIRNLGSLRVQIDVTGTQEKSAILTQVKERILKSRKGDWILGRGWDQNDWSVKEFPSAADLDGVSRANPVVLERIDGHAYWVNSLALKLAGIDANTKDPEGGKILRDANGNPTGILVDNAATLVDDKIPALTTDQEIERTKIALQESLQKGLTMLHDAGSSAANLEAWKTLASRNELPVRIYSMVSMPTNFGEEYLKTGPKNYGPYLDVRSLKLVMDGAMGSRGAAFLEPYTDDPPNSGLLMWKEDEMMRVLKAAKSAGIQVGIHAIGDRANRMILDAYEKTGVKGLRWRIEHVQILAPSDIPRLAKLDVIASMQPIHATSDMPWAQERIGPERIKGAYAWRSLLDRHTLIAGGSDAPVEDINPLWGIYAAITRQDHQGKPDDGWLPEQKITRMEALRMFTIDAAFAAFRENELGSLKAGKLADIIVLPQNLLVCDPKDLITMKVLYTIVGGKIRYQHKD